MSEKRRSGGATGGLSIRRTPALNPFVASSLRAFVAPAMIIGVLHFELLIHGAESLKDKRRVVRSVKDRLHREHLVSVAEVASLEVLNQAVLAAAIVGTDGAKIGSTLDRMTEKLRGLRDAELGFARRELLRPGRDGAPASEPIDEAALAAELLGYADEETNA